MGLYRAAVLSRMQMQPNGWTRARFGPPATARDIAVAEAALGLPLPGPLREMYAEFDGLWFGEVVRNTPENEDLDQWDVLPLHLLPVCRNRLAHWYGPDGGSWGDGIEGFGEQLARCVPFAVYEGIAAFSFMTDLGAWGIEPGVVAVWDHDGGSPTSYGETLLDLLTETATNVSQD